MSEPAAARPTPAPPHASAPRFPYGAHDREPADPSAPAIAAEDLRVAYPHSPVLALADVDLFVPQGTRQALVGPNGAGKSTLLMAAAGLLPIVGGRLTVLGLPPGGAPRRVAYLAQRATLDWTFPVTVRRLVMGGRYAHLGWLRRPDAGDAARVDAVIERLGIAALAERRIQALSGGQQQRALLARALAQDAELLLLDEPLNAVDAESRAVIDGVLDALRDEGRTVIVATHDLGRLEADYDGVLYLAEGRTVAPPPGGFVVDAHEHGHGHGVAAHGGAGVTRGCGP